ncbi:hypothetical protein EK21DRAFT_74785 [Setomelanomma holmii]|uniref:Uncharacterized protein n=1 Tax=Setomelanomma holmii TaxID=210430 RepID=A0A9P4H0K0_9PLEO|nr:hypothetical protein EK21DRAFT_74785 [Setomelanomma holmii]
MRRPAIPRWTRCLGMTNIGACAGVLGAHGYLQHTGERQKAYRRLDRRLKRRSLEFWAIFWDKLLMAKFDPVVQQYVRHNGLWYTSNLPDTVFDQPDDYSGRIMKNKTAASKADSNTSTPIEQTEQEEPFYTQPFDYVDDLANINVESTRDKMAELEAERDALLREGEYILFMSAQKEYDYCHTKYRDDDERHQRLLEIMLCQIAYNRTHTAACAIDNKLAQWRMSLRHKAALEAGDESLESWLPESAKSVGAYERHDPTLLMQEVEKFQAQIAAEVKRFDELVRDEGYERWRRDGWRRDLEDGRRLLRAVDGIWWEMEGRRKMLEEKRRQNEVEDAQQTAAPEKSATSPGHPTKTKVAAMQDAKMMAESESTDKAEAEKKSDKKQPTGSMEPDKP